MRSSCYAEMQSWPATHPVLIILGGVGLLAAVVLQSRRRLALGGLGCGALGSLGRLLGLHVTVSMQRIKPMQWERHGSTPTRQPPPLLPHLLLRHLLLLLRELLPALELTAGPNEIANACAVSRAPWPSRHAITARRTHGSAAMFAECAIERTSCSGARPSHRAAPPRTSRAAPTPSPSMSLQSAVDPGSNLDVGTRRFVRDGIQTLQRSMHVADRLASGMLQGRPVLHRAAMECHVT